MFMFVFCSCVYCTFVCSGAPFRQELKIQLARAQEALETALKDKETAEKIMEDFSCDCRAWSLDPRGFSSPSAARWVSTRVGRDQWDSVKKLWQHHI